MKVKLQPQAVPAKPKADKIYLFGLNEIKRVFVPETGIAVGGLAFTYAWSRRRKHCSSAS